MLTEIDKIIQFNKLIWKTKKELGIKLNEPIEIPYYPEELNDYKKDLVACHKLILKKEVKNNGKSNR